MRRWRILTILPLLLGVVACADSPIPASRDLTFQEELRKAEHWKVLATQTARQVAQIANSTAGDPEADFFVEPLDPGMPFARSFHDYLLTALLAEGIPVSLTRGAAYRIHYSARLVPHEEWVRTPPTGSVALLGAGIWGLRDIFRGTGEGIATDLTPILIWEGINASGILGKYAEVTFAVSVLEGTRLAGRADATYYVPENEVANFLPSGPAAPLVVRRPDWADDPPLVRDFPVVSE